MLQVLDSQKALEERQDTVESHLADLKCTTSTLSSSSGDVAKEADCYTNPVGRFNTICLDTIPIHPQPLSKFAPNSLTHRFWCPRLDIIPLDVDWVLYYTTVQKFREGDHLQALFVLKRGSQYGRTCHV